MPALPGHLSIMFFVTFTYANLADCVLATDGKKVNGLKNLLIVQCRKAKIYSTSRRYQT